MQTVDIHINSKNVMDHIHCHLVGITRANVESAMILYMKIVHSLHVSEQ